LLANWVHRRGEDWRDRVGAWLPAGCDAWALQREVLDPAAYVSLWLHDAGDVAGPDYLTRYDAWLAALEADRVEGIGFGWITLRRLDDDPGMSAGSPAPRPATSSASGPAISPGTGPVTSPATSPAPGASDVRAAGTHRVEEWTSAVDAPLGPYVAEAFARTAWLRARDDSALLGARLSVAESLTQELIGEPGAEDPTHVVLRQSEGFRRARRVDTATAALVGASTGEAPVGVLLDAVATLLGEDEAAVRDRLVPVVRDLVTEGYLLPDA
jgi:hypothetical protein